MGVKPQIDDVTDAQSVDISQLRFGRLTGCCYPIIKPPPVVDRFRVAMKTLATWMPVFTRPIWLWRSRDGELC